MSKKGNRIDSLIRKVFIDDGVQTLPMTCSKSRRLKTKKKKTEDKLVYC